MWSPNSFLTEKLPWYKAWTENPHSSPFHLAVFGVVAILTFTSVFQRVADLVIMQEEANMAVALLATRPPAAAPGERSRADQVEPTEVIVGYAPGIGESKRSEVAQALQLTKQGEIKALNAVIYTTGESDTPREVADRVRHLHQADVLFVEPNVLLTPEQLPNDPLFNTEWHLPKVGIDTGWDVTVGSSTTVAVLDTGVDCTHPDLVDNCRPGFNIPSNNTNTADIYGHGTKVAGVIAAIADNGLGVAGAAHQASIMPIRITNDSQGMASYSDIANGILYAADHGVKIANVSYAAYDSQTIASAAAYLVARGGILTMAAGNAGTVSTVKNDPNFIVVSATDSSDARTPWSTYGSPVDTAAPGSAISTTAPGGGFISMSGTSFAAPLTAAVAALVWSAVPTLSNVEVQNVLLGTAVDKGSAGYDQEYGFGRLDAKAAVAAALSGAIPTITYPNSSQNQPLVLTSYAVISKTKNSGVVAWATNLPATGRVRYGTSNTALNQVVDVPVVTVSQQATITGLDPRKKYYYQVEALDAAGTLVKSPVTEFRTTRK